MKIIIEDREWSTMMDGVKLILEFGTVRATIEEWRWAKDLEEQVRTELEMVEADLEKEGVDDIEVVDRSSRTFK